ncbi:MAG: hypothetical protein Q4F95_13370 [Oscillospiraceae bacterium]|nr:hypothetical protein [Oscillospiraceae bacterium]
MVRRKLAFILAVSFAFAAGGCTETGSGSQTDDPCKGRYIEEEISIQDRPSVGGELYRQNNKTLFYDYYNSKLYTQDDQANTFTAADFPSLDELGDDVSPDSVAFLPDGSYIFTYYLPDDSSKPIEEMTYSEYYAYMSADGKIRKLDLGLKYSSIDAFECSDDGRIFASSFEGNVYEISIEDSSAKLIFNVNSQPVCFDVVSDYIICADSRNISFYSLTDNSLMETPQILKDFWKQQKFSTEGMSAFDPVCDFCEGTDNSVYIITANGLYRYIIDGNQIEQLLDAMSYHLGSPSCSVRSVVAESEQSFLVIYKEGRVMRYRYDPSASNAVSSSLKIYSLTQNDTLDQIISEYKIQNPDIAVEYETGIEKDSGITYEDAIKNLNTEICSDGAPDIIMLDAMDTDNYIDKNILLDLKDYEDKIDPDDSLLDNIAKHYKNDGLYTMSCRFEIPVLAGKKENLAKIDSFSTLADMIESQHSIVTDRTVAEFYTPQEVLETAFEFTADEIMTDDGVNTKALAGMLDDCLRIYKSERSVLTDNQVENHTYNKTCSQSPICRWGYEAAGYSMLIKNNEEKLACGTADGFLNSLNIITSLDTDNPDIEYRYGLTDNSTLYIPKCSLGICCAGKNSDNAAEFIKTAFSQSVQDIELGDGLPVNKKSLEYFYSKGKTDKGKGFSLGDPFSDRSVCLWANWMDNAEVNRFSSKLQMLDTPVYLDTMTRDVIIQTGSKCLDSIITVEQAAEEIDEKISLKLQE